MGTKEKILESGVIAIFRRLYKEELCWVCDALYDGGIRLMEVAFDQKDPEGIDHTVQSLKILHRRHPDLTLGAGTVLTQKQLQAACEAGASYMVAPNVNPALIAAAHQYGMAAMPGAMTPTEVVSAWQSGADLVKLFPAGYLGADYVRHLRAPLNHIPLVATAGIAEENFADFLKAGCVAAGISSPLMDQKCIAAGDAAALTERARRLMQIFRRSREE